MELLSMKILRPHHDETQLPVRSLKLSIVEPGQYRERMRVTFRNCLLEIRASVSVLFVIFSRASSNFSVSLKPAIMDLHQGRKVITHASCVISMLCHRKPQCRWLLVDQSFFRHVDHSARQQCPVKCILPSR